MRAKEEIQEDIERINRAKKAAVKMQIWCVGRRAELDKELKEVENGKHIQAKRELYKRSENSAKSRPKE